MLGGFGILIAAVLFFAWKDHPGSGHRFVAWAGLVWAIASLLCIVTLIASNGS